MKKINISKLFLYRYRFVIGYFMLTLAFIALIFSLPLLSPGGISQAEMRSAVESSQFNHADLLTGQITDAPYRLLQKLSISTLGLTIYAIKLPSIIIGLFFGFFLVLLLNRWFKSNVALVTSVITVLSTPFLFLVGTGTPLIMFVFYPTILLWLGSKIKNSKKPNYFSITIFTILLLSSLTTPYLVYFALAILVFIFLRPHTRLIVKNLPKPVLIILTALALSGFGFLGFHYLKHPAHITPLFINAEYATVGAEKNLDTAFLPFFTWNTTLESVRLSPLVGLATISLALIGFISTSRKLFSSKSSIAFALFLFTVLISCLDPEASILLLLPIAILVAHGISYIFTSWYSLFPENPYARIFALIPIGIFLGFITVSSLSHYIFGYRYTPAVAHHFRTDLTLIRQNLSHQDILLIPAGTLEYDFYKLLENHTKLTVTSNFPEQLNQGQSLATLGLHPEKLPDHITLSQIITSSKIQNSDRIYLYTANN